MYPAMITALKHQPDAEPEHPVVAWIAVVAIVAAILFISWARIAVQGTGDLEAALSDEPGSQEEQGSQASAPRDKSEHNTQLDDAVAASRWASAFSP
jgi:flagellar biosynthesis/type III secretory pathway M-ring protein FliF/YscJ